MSKFLHDDDEADDDRSMPISTFSSKTAELKIISQTDLVSLSSETYVLVSLNSYFFLCYPAASPGPISS